MSGDQGNMVSQGNFIFLCNPRTGLVIDTNAVEKETSVYL